MTDAQRSTQSPDSQDAEVIGKGMNVLVLQDSVVGTVRAVRSPQEVMKLMKSGEGLSDTVMVTRGGAVTFAGPLLLKKPAAVITIEGAPESHLGILSREFSVPAVMSLELTDSSVQRFNAAGMVSNEYAEHVLSSLDGRRVRLDCSQPEEAKVLSADAPSPSDG